MKILVTGSAGFIGFHCSKKFLDDGFEVLGIDNMNDYYDPRLKDARLAKLECYDNFIFKKVNIAEKEELTSTFKSFSPEIVVHLAAQSLVDETINKKKYYKNNVIATNSLLKSMKKNGINKLVFSSTAAVYQQSSNPLKENSKLKPLSTYAKTKLVCEKNILKQKDIKSVILRFFNVCSALKKPCIGELHNPETHLIPTIVYKAIYNKRSYIYGNDFSTPDGTCIRDYIHIKDICSAIEKSVKFLLNKKKGSKTNFRGRGSKNNSTEGSKSVRRNKIIL